MELLSLRFVISFCSVLSRKSNGVELFLLHISASSSSDKIGCSLSSMFISGRSIQYEKRKRAFDDVDNLLKDCSQDAIAELKQLNCDEIAKKYKKMKIKAEQSILKHNAFVSSSLASEEPKLVIENTICESSQENFFLPENIDISSLDWDTLHDIILYKCEQDMTLRHEQHDVIVKNRQMRLAKLYPEIAVKPSIEDNLQKHMNIEQNYAQIILTTYNMICDFFIKSAKAKVQDTPIQKTDPSICAYAIIQTHPWVEDFLNAVQKRNTMSSELDILNKKFFVSLKGRRKIDDRISETNLSFRNYMLDLPYHFCRFLTLFGSVVFSPTTRDATMFEKNERFTDTQLLLHFAIMSDQDERIYKDFIRNEHSFCVRNQMYIAALFQKVINILDKCFPNDIMTDFYTDNKGNMRLYKREPVHNLNVSHVSGDQQPMRKVPVEIPEDVVRILRPFILPDIKRFREDRQMDYNTGERDKFETLNFEYIHSPLAKLLNFDIQAQLEKTNNIYEKETFCPISINKQLDPQIYSLPSMYNVYAILLQAVKLIQFIHKVTHMNHSEILNYLIIDGNDINRPATICYVPIFEAFPGSFYLLFYKSLISKNNNNSKFIFMQEYSEYFSLFERYSLLIPSVWKKQPKPFTFQSEFILPTKVRWVNAIDIISLMLSSKKDIHVCRSKFIKDMRSVCEEEESNELLKYFQFHHPDGQELSSPIQIDKVVGSSNTIARFLRLPITMFLKKITLEVHERNF